MRSILSSILVLILLAGCGPTETQVPLNTPGILPVQTTITLRPLGELFKICIEEQANMGLVLEELPAPALDPDQANLTLRWGLHESTVHYAAQFGEEELVIITHPENPVEQISLAQLQAIYQDQTEEWMAPAPSVAIEPWAYPPGEDVQQVFEAAIQEGAPVGERIAYLAPDPSAMRQAVAENPSAIGFIPRRWLDPTVKEITISGLAPDQLRQPFVVLSNLEPDGPEKVWLLCLQDHLSE